MDQVHQHLLKQRGIGFARRQSLDYKLDTTSVIFTAHFINNAPQKFAEDGTLTDEKTAKAIGGLLEGLRAWTVRLRSR